MLSPSISDSTGRSRSLSNALKSNPVTNTDEATSDKIELEKRRSSWIPTSRPRIDTPDQAQPVAVPSKLVKSSGTWQPSPPPSKTVVSPVKSTAGKLPWEPSPPPNSKPKQPSSLSDFLARDADEKASPATPGKKMWSPIPVVAATPIQDQLAANKTPRRDSAQSTSSSFADVALGRSRQNSYTEPVSKVTTPIRILSPVSPVVSRSASPAVPALSRTLSSLGSIPTVSSPLANLNTGKAIRIVSKVEKPEEPAIEVKDQEQEKSQRKSVPAASIKKSREQKLAEQREKSDKRKLEQPILSSPESALAPSTEVSPIIGRTRKQKKAIVHAPSPRAEPVEKVPEKSPEKIFEVTPEPAAIPAETQADILASMDFTKSALFKPIFTMDHTFEFTEEELTKGAALLQYSKYTGKESISQLEKMLSKAQAEAAAHQSKFEEIQRMNRQLVSLPSGPS